MITKLFLDMDGVITDFNKGVLKLFGAKNDPYLNPKNKGIELYKLLNISKGEFYKNLDYNFWVSLEWMPDGMEIFKLVKSKFKEKVCILTSPVMTVGCLEGKKTWINRNLPEMNQRWLIGPDKSFAASPQAVLVDDNENKIEKFKLAGGNGILIPRPWNNAEDVNVVTYLKSMLNVIK